MNKLSQVREALEGNTSIVVVNCCDINYIPHRDGYWSQTMSFVVAPKEGIFEAERLQSFMMSLVPGLEPTMVDQFRDAGDLMDFGKLYFDEDIGTEQVRREITLTDESLFGMDGFTNGKRVILEKLQVQRRTWVRLFPSEAVARACLEGTVPSKYSINKKVLQRFRGKK
ncbi:MAG: hypothetical protein WCV83_00625 [Candidatus Magasanikbacteria bacterium]